MGNASLSGPVVVSENIGSVDKEDPAIPSAPASDLRKTNVKSGNMEVLQTLLQEVNTKIDKMHQGNNAQAQNTRTLIADVSTTLDNILEKVNNLQNIVNTHKAENDAKLATLRNRVIGLEKRLNSEKVAAPAEIATAVLGLKKDVEFLKAKPPVKSGPIDTFSEDIEAIQQTLNRNNIVIRGLEVNSKNALQDVRDFISSRLQVPGLVTEVRLRRFTDLKGGIITATLDSYNPKQSILSAKKVLAASCISINPDLTRTQRNVAKKIRDEARKFRSKGKTVRVRYNSLVVDGTTFRWDKVTQQLVIASKHAHLKPSPFNDNVSDLANITRQPQDCFLGPKLRPRSQ